MEGKRICPFIYAAEQVRMAIERGIEDENKADKQPREMICLGSGCAVWNEGMEGCGLVGMKALSPEEFKAMARDIDPFGDLKK